jgi:3-oxoacyl-(acyl-carrier-protein) synthase
MNNRTAIVDLSSINAYNKHTNSQVVTHRAWGFPLGMQFDNLAEEVVLKLEESIRDNVTKVILCSAQGDAYGKDTMFDIEKNQKKKRARPGDALTTTGTGLVVKLSGVLPMVNDIFKIDATCASGIKAMEIGQMMTNNTDDLVMLLGVECSTAPYIAFSFGSIFATCQSEKYLGPFDLNRNGFALGDGAGAIVICNEQTANKLKLPIKAYIDSVGFLTAVTDQPSQPSNLAVLSEFVENTIEKSKIQKTDIAYWDAHATATVLGDQVEYDLFVNTNIDAPISSFKGAIGHCMSAAAIVETVNAIEHLHRGVIPMNHGTETTMVADDRIILSNESTTKKSFVKCSFGFGGRNGAAVITVV